MKASRLVAGLGGPLLAAALLWISFRGVDLTELGAITRQLNYPLLALNLAAAPLHLILRAYRWKALLRPVAPTLPARETFSATAIGYLAGLLPARVGELLRPALLHRRTGVPFGPALATAGVERIILDLLMILLLGAIALLLPGSLSGLDGSDEAEWMGQLRRAGGIVLALTLGGLMAVHLMGKHRESLARRLESSGSALFGRFLRWLATLLPGFEVLASWRGLATTLLDSLFIWLTTAGGIWAGIAACGGTLPPAGIFLLLPVLVVGISIPTPGNTGTFHFAMKLGLVSIFGMPEQVAIAAGLIVHLSNWLPLILIGSTCIALGGTRSARSISGHESG